MKAYPSSVLAALLALSSPLAVFSQEDAYVPGPDSKPQPGVPQGDLIKFAFADSKVFPGTTRQVTVYVPRQYDPGKPACVYVDQDGVQWDAPVVLDNLIARGELPVIVGVFVTPGVVTSRNPATELSRFNRSFEYDGLGDAYARLILDEVLPAVEAKSTPDGRMVHLSHSANDRAIAGSSSGAIAAFTVAWEHPEAFSRVLSSIGTYVGLRGGEIYPTLIRKYEPKPIRVFLQDGSHDLNIYGGDWWMANQTMERALIFAGYEVNHVWGDGMHSGKHIGAILPDALRWLWKDWPTPVTRGQSQNGALKALLIPGEEWQVDETLMLYNIAGPAFDAKGHMSVSMVPEIKTGPGGTVVEPPVAAKDRRSVRFGPDGRFYSSEGSHIVAYSMDGGPPHLLAEGIACRDLVVAHNGNIYVTESATAAAESKVWLVTPDGAKKVVDSGLRSATGVTLSPDQSLLYVADGASHWIYSYQVQPDGSLAYKQRYYWLHTADIDDESHAGGMCCDQAGWLYVATDLGIQVCDQAGRVNAILPVPSGRATDLCFGGEKFDTLYATCGATLFKRRLKATGANPWAAPTLPSTPRL
jgi:predicted alpha/beta superfamily hydrolase